jgi:hypothetical protein
MEDSGEDSLDGSSIVRNVKDNSLLSCANVVLIEARVFSSLPFRADGEFETE